MDEWDVSELTAMIDVKKDKFKRKTYRDRGNIPAVGIWIVKEGMENQATGSRGFNLNCNGKRDALLRVNNKRIQNNHIAYYL